jgi:DNA-binding NarL/FixJ family response regulator
MAGFLIVDDHPLFGEALGNAIRISHPDARILEAASIKGALAILATEPTIDLALLDLLLPDADGFSGFQRLRDLYPKLPIAIVSSHEDQHTINEALEMGAVGYIPKSASLSELSQAIARVLSGSVATPKHFVAGRVRDRSGATLSLGDRLMELTPQQMRVLHLITRGLQNREIAAELKLAESTVKAHVTEILRKLRLFSRNKVIIEMKKLAAPPPKSRQSGRSDRQRSAELKSSQTSIANACKRR